MINDLKKSDTWKTQLTIITNFISTRDDNDKEHVMHSKRDNTKLMISDETDKVIKKNFFILFKIDVKRI